MNIHPVVIDCDTGRDDVLALLLALKLDIPLQAVVCSYGNTSLRNVTDNTARVLALASRDDMPLWPGAETPGLNHAGYDRVVKPRQEISGNGICNITLPESRRVLPAPQSPTELAENLRFLAAEQGPVDYIIIGPATNFASICGVLGPDVHKVVSRITMMAGKFDALWDTIPGADFNTVCDPFALRQIFKAGYRVRFVPMNFTWNIALSLDDVLKTMPETRMAAFLKDIMIAQCRNFAPDPIFRFHDPCVICALERPEKFMPCSMEVNCDEKSPDFGRIEISEKGFLAEIFKADQSIGDQFLKRILGSLGFKAAATA